MLTTGLNQSKVCLIGLRVTSRFLLASNVRIIVSLADPWILSRSKTARNVLSNFSSVSPFSDAKDVRGVIVGPLAVIGRDSVDEAVERTEPTEFRERRDDLRRIGDWFGCELLDVSLGFDSCQSCMRRRFRLSSKDNIWLLARPCMPRSSC